MKTTTTITTTRTRQGLCRSLSRVSRNEELLSRAIRLLLQSISSGSRDQALRAFSMSSWLVDTLRKELATLRALSDRHPAIPRAPAPREG